MVRQAMPAAHKWLVGVLGRSLGRSGQADQLPIRHTIDSGEHLVAIEEAAAVDVQVS